MSILFSAATAVTLVVGGSSPTPYAGGPVNPPWLHGQFDSVVTQYVPYPASLGAPFEGSIPLPDSVDQGVKNTIAMQDASAGPVTIMGTSQGSLVIDRVMAQDMQNGVSPSKVQFVIIENPEGQDGALTQGHRLGVDFQGYRAIPKPVTQYSVTKVTVENDGVADLPNVPTSPGYFLALVNAFMGGMYLHSTAQLSDLSKVPAANVTRTTNSLGGVTTSYLVPTPTLPLLMPLQQMGVPGFIVGGLNGLLKPLVDSAYSRGGQTSTAAKTSVAHKPKTVSAVKSAPKPQIKPLSAVKTGKHHK